MITTEYIPQNRHMPSPVRPAEFHHELAMLHVSSRLYLRHVTCNRNTHEDN